MENKGQVIASGDLFRKCKIEWICSLFFSRLTPCGDHNREISR